MDVRFVRRMAGWALLAALVAAASVRAGEDAPEAPAPRLVVSAGVQRVTRAGATEPEDFLYGSLVWVNDTDEPMVVPTQCDRIGFQAATENMPRHIVGLEYRAAGVKFKDYVLVTPPAEFAFTSIRRGEAADLNVDDSRLAGLVNYLKEQAEPHPAFPDDAPEPLMDAPVSVYVLIEPAFGERYGCWSGRLEIRDTGLAFKDNKPVYTAPDADAKE